jgi:hypothetical protein
MSKIGLNVVFQGRDVVVAFVAGASYAGLS